MADRDLSTSDEVWYPIPGTPGYELSSDLRVRKPELIYAQKGPSPRQCTATGRWEIVKFSWIKGRAAFFHSRKGAKKKMLYLHRAVAMLAYGPIPDGMFVRHYDDDVTNNYTSNLCFGTYLDNAVDRERNGHAARGEKIGTSRLTEEKVQDIRFCFARQKRSINEISRDFDVSRSTIVRVVKRVTWTHVA